MKIFDNIPTQRPSTPLLDTIDSPNDLRQLSRDDLPVLADQLREYLLYSVGQTGGHFGAGLGVVELTVALHYLFETPGDRIVWDVGHQTYPHKILTGRREEMLSMRQKNGLSAFPKRSESTFDTFGVGHSSTSISAALGMAIAARKEDNLTHNTLNSSRKRRVAAVIGDGAMTAGMAFEAMNHAADDRSDMLVILNDNNMSISNSVGGLSNYFARVWSSKLYISIRKGGKKVLSNMPATADFVKRTEASMKNLVSPDALFEAIGFNYVGPIDGHNLDELMHAIENMRDLEGPQLLHIYTTKGKGYSPAESDPIKYHALGKIESPKSSTHESTPKPTKKFQTVFGEWLCDMAEQNSTLEAITPAMCEGSGMVKFAKRFPERFHDVAIAEQHAVTLAAGMACEGVKPVVAIYSTFLQRGYDQLIHDVCLQDLDVTFGIDRAGIVGEDGATHAGLYDYAYMRCLPNMIIAAPSDENECRQLLYTAYQHEGPASVRYPRGTGIGAKIDKEMTAFPIGKGRIRREGKDIAILAFGTLLHEALEAAETLNATVVDMRFVKPLDEALIQQLVKSHTKLVTIEDHVTQAGAGSAVLEFLSRKEISIPCMTMGVPDIVVPHGTRAELLDQFNLNAAGIMHTLRP